MSYGSRTQYPSRSSTGRGRGGTRRAPEYTPHMMNRPEEPGLHEEQEGEGEGEDGSIRHRPEVTRGASERKMQRRSQGAHYVLSPDPAKNSKLKNAASREESEYTRYKEEKRETTAQRLAYQPPAQVGGMTHTQQQLRLLREQQEKEQQKEAKFAAVRNRKKRDEYQRVQRERENAELDKMKMIQREKGLRVAAKKEEQLKVDQEDLRRKRLAYYDQPKR